MKKKLYTGMLVGMLAVTLTVTPCYATTAQSQISDAENAQEKNREKLKDSQGKINTLESQKGSLEENLKNLNKQLDELSANLKDIQKQSEEKQKDLDKLEKELVKAQEKEKEQYEKMKLRIQYMYEKADTSYLVAFLESDSLAEMLAQMETMSELTKYDRKMLKEYKETTREIKEKEECIKEEKAGLEKLEQESLDKQDEISEVVRSTHNQIASYESQISAEEGNVKSLMSEIENQENKINSLIKQQKEQEMAQQTPDQGQSGNNSLPSTPPQEQLPAPEESKPGDNASQNQDSGNTGNSQGKYLGKFRLTAYCPCALCCGISTGITASGTRATQGRTIAMGGVPFGTKLLINGTVYTVEDRGTPYGHVDIFFNSHQDALNFGSGYADVYQVN